MACAGNILIVDDDPRLCRLLARYLRQENYAVRIAGSGSEMRRALDAETADLVILDLVLPDESGLDLARELRAARAEIAVLMLTGKCDTVDKVVGLEIGADDYVTKPFDERELLARVHSLLRRAARRLEQPDTQRIAHFDGWRLELRGYQLTSPAGERVQLTAHEFQLLAGLVEHNGRVLSREAILDDVFGRDWNPNDRSVDVLVGKLRRKLNDDPDNPRLIRTVRGVGYKLAVPVHFH